MLIRSSFKKWGLPSFLVSLAVGAVLLASMVQVDANHGSALHNAIRKKDVGAYGAYAVIQDTNPNLHAGQWTYLRTILPQQSPWRYGEIGWQKLSTGSKQGLIVWENPNYGTFTFTYSSGTDHSFMIWYDQGSGNHWFYYDGSFVLSQNLGFSQGTQALCGGEVATGVEGMGNTRCGNTVGSGLQYQIPNGSGGFTWTYWNGNVVYVVDPPYTTAYIDSNSFRVAGNE